MTTTAPNVSLSDEVLNEYYPLFKSSGMHGLNAVLDSGGRLTSPVPHHKPNYFVVRKEVPVEVPVLPTSLSPDDQPSELTEPRTEIIYEYYPVKVDKSQLESGKLFVDLTSVPAIAWSGVLMLAKKTCYKLHRKDILRGRFYVKNQIRAEVLFPVEPATTRLETEDNGRSDGGTESSILQEAELAFVEQSTTLYGAPNPEEEW